MSAYIVAQIEIEDIERYEQYRQTVMPTIEAYGGRFVVRGGNPQTLEGSWTPSRVVIIEFDSLDSAKAWHESVEYAPARQLRQTAARSEMILVEGV